MKQNYVRRLLKQPHPQMLTHDRGRQLMTEMEHYLVGAGRRYGGGGKTRMLAAQELDRHLTKKIMFGPRYMTARTSTPIRIPVEMSYADLERRARDMWAVSRSVGSPFFTKELNDNAWGGGL